MLENPQPSIPEVSCRQNSPADAGVAIAMKAIANSAVAGAAVSFINCFILFFPVFDLGPRSRHGIVSMSAPSTAKNSNGMLSGAQPAKEMQRAGFVS
jgi:hypothetical protein